MKGQRVFLALSLVLPGLPGPVLASPSFTELTHCAALFQARADWMQKTGDRARAATDFAQRTSNLAEYSFEAYSNADWGILHGYDGPRTFPDYKDKIDNLALEILTYYAGQDFKDQTLPTCKDDPVCQQCMEIYNGLDFRPEGVGRPGRPHKKNR